MRHSWLSSLLLALLLGVIAGCGGHEEKPEIKHSNPFNRLKQSTPDSGPPKDFKPLK